MARVNATTDGTPYADVSDELVARGLRADDDLHSTGGYGYVQYHGRIDVDGMLESFKALRGCAPTRFHAASGGLILLGA